MECPDETDVPKRGPQVRGFPKFTMDRLFFPKYLTGWHFLECSLGKCWGYLGIIYSNR